MIVFCADIHGLNDAKVAHLKAAFAAPVIFISPYQHLAECNFDKNYESFCHHVGMQTYIDIVKKCLQEIKQTPFIAIGESVGATALWCNSAWLEPQQCKAAFCLYGSRIRQYLDIQPSCPTHLIFSEDEACFLNPQVTQKLQSRSLVCLDQVELPHGFASPSHPAFNLSEFNRWCQQIKRL